MFEVAVGEAGVRDDKIDRQVAVAMKQPENDNVGESRVDNDRLAGLIQPRFIVPS